MKTGLCGLYCFKNKNNEIIYLGKADDIHKRLKTHRHLPKECYEEIEHIEYTVINNKADRDILELLFITQYKPKYNTQLKYKESPTILTDQQIMLFWNKEENIQQYDFLNHQEKYLKTGTVGRPKIKIPDNFPALYKQWKCHEITEICQRLLFIKK